MRHLFAVCRQGQTCIVGRSTCGSYRTSELDTAKPSRPKTTSRTTPLRSASPRTVPHLASHQSATGFGAAIALLEQEGENEAKMGIHESAFMIHIGTFISKGLQQMLLRAPLCIQIAMFKCGSTLPGRVQSPSRSPRILTIAELAEGAQSCMTRCFGAYRCVVASAQEKSVVSDSDANGALVR